MEGFERKKKKKKKKKKQLNPRPPRLRLLFLFKCIRAIHRDKRSQLLIQHLKKGTKKTRTSQCPPRGKAPAVAEPAMLASAAAVALTTVLEILLDFQAACAFPGPEPRREMHDGIASALGAREERLGSHRGSGASRAEDDVDRDDDDDEGDEDEDEARPPQEAAAAARAAIVFFLLAAGGEERESVCTHAHKSEGPCLPPCFKEREKEIESLARL